MNIKKLENLGVLKKQAGTVHSPASVMVTKLLIICKTLPNIEEAKSREKFRRKLDCIPLLVSLLKSSFPQRVLKCVEIFALDNNTGTLSGKAYGIEEDALGGGGGGAISGSLKIE